MDACYWAGFITADGYLQDSYRLKLLIVTSDVAHLEKFKKTIGYTGAIEFETNTNAVTLRVAGVKSWFD